ncbi:MAG TPA: penicillin acylase family protein [Pirellulales bacterium]|nr:penicillin acylase family protein [Pirellulales bacterium]
MSCGLRTSLSALVAGLFLACSSTRTLSAAESGTIDPQALARDVTIYRDKYGMPHIDGKNDEAVIFGFGYAQAEDFFWQIEDSYALALGRYAELYGKQFLDKDMRNRAFEIPQKSRADFQNLDPQLQRMGEAFVGGINYYLDTHPRVKPRMLKRMEPWYLLAFARAAILELLGGHMHVPGGEVPSSYGEQKLEEEVRAATGSNALAIAGSRTRSGKPLLFINPHQPYYGYGQFYEAHLRSGEGWNFTGASFFGTPSLALGHNEYCGWGFTTNEPSVGSSWKETFDDPDEPLNYRYDGGYRKAEEWTDTIKVKRGGSDTESIKVTLRKTHHGPILRKTGEKEYISGNIGKLYDSLFSRQAMQMVRAKNIDDFRAAMGMLEIHLFNTVYADVHGNIYYLYNGVVPKRDPGFDWEKPVDGADKRTEWQGIHPLADLPQVLNPSSGYVQNCNSTPYTTTDNAGPAIGDYPHYMVEDRYDDKRRAKMARMLLEDAHDMTFDRWQELAFDTTIYWALTELPRYKRDLEKLRETDPDLAGRVAPYLEHLLDWNCKGSIESTQTTLCVAWYEELYGFGYPAEKLKQQFVSNVPEQFKALIAAAKKLETNFGNWKVPYGDINRLQRHANVSDFMKIPFSDNVASIPSAGIPGPPGVIFTMYFSPTVYVPPLKVMKKHYAVVGSSYMCVVDFSDKVTSKSLLPYGASGDPKSPHFFDQAQLLSQKKLKDNPFHWDDVVAAAKRTYHPGETSTETAGAR